MRFSYLPLKSDSWKNKIEGQDPSRLVSDKLLINRRICLPDNWLALIVSR